MSELKNKKIILGITGSISAYKAPYIVRALLKEGAEVKIVMTPSAVNFVTPLVLQNLSKNNVVIEMFSKDVQSDGSWHIHLAHWADAMLIAPCSMKTLASVSYGFTDTSLACVAVALPKTTPLFIAPAMDTDMWEHPSTQRNIAVLENDGAIIIPPESGELASGIIGIGRLPEPEMLVTTLISYFTKQPKHDVQHIADLNNSTISSLPLLGKNVLITAGPTIERIDDVRYISNHSTGKMGYAIAKVAKEQGASVTLISGPVSVPPIEGVHTIKVESAHEMYEKTIEHKDSYDIAILTAAVADYTPKSKVHGKIKKQQSGDEFIIELTQTKDILASLGNAKNERQYLVGFALESENLVEYARQKLTKKNCDMIVANEANKQDSGFYGDKNTITIIKKSDGGSEPSSLPPMPKVECAREILQHIIADIR